MKTTFTFKKNEYGTFSIYMGDGPYMKLKSDSNMNYRSVNVAFNTERQAAIYCKMKNKFHARSTQWHRVWRKAMANVPVRRTTSTVRRWDPMDDKLPLPEYIKGSVKKRPIYKLEDGVVWRLTVEKTVHEFGHYATLARLLGYWNHNKHTGKVTPHGMAVHTAYYRGSMPKTPEQREILMILADRRTGPRYARARLREMGRLHLYDV